MVSYIHESLYHAIHVSHRVDGRNKTEQIPLGAVWVALDPICRGQLGFRKHVCAIHGLHGPPCWHCGFWFDDADGLVHVEGKVGWHVAPY